MKNLKQLVRVVSITILFCFVWLGLSRSGFAFQEKSKKEQEKKKQKEITEEIVVEAQAPKDLPISTTSTIKERQILTLASRDLSEVLSFAPGTFVSSGAKNEFRLQIRGFAGQRIVLLYDGIPIYEPYFNSFDLKTLPADAVENLKIVKGASSVLYGPNALGGVVNIITKRPQPPSFSLHGLYDSNGGYAFSTSGSLRWDNFLFSAFLNYDESEKFQWNKNGQNVAMENSDFRRFNILGKVYYYPGENQEILFEIGQYVSEFGIPSAQEFYSARYWRFNKWNRTQLNLGGTFTLWGTGTLKFRSYYVSHANVLDAYTDSQFSDLQWESTYDNSSYGIFILSSLPYLTGEEFKFSLNFRNDKVKIQDDLGADWEEYSHQTVSLGIENDLPLGPKWKLIGGLSLDFLKKQTGENKTSLNPIGGVKFTPYDVLDFHLTLSKKSRFPPMNSLYSMPNGNPDLQDEQATSLELGCSYTQEFNLTGAVFYNRIKDLIQRIRLPSGYNTYLNIGNARIFGFEAGIQKNWGPFGFSVNYTYLNGEDVDESRPLDLIPKSQFNFMVDVRMPLELTLSIWGLAVSPTQVDIKGTFVDNPDYFVLNAVIEKTMYRYKIFVRVDNILNSYYTTEPGYPMKSRTFSIGFRADFNEAGIR